MTGERARAGSVIPVGYDLISWSSGKLTEFPRKHRFTIGDRLAERQLDVLELLLVAQFEPAQRREALRAANLGLEKVRYLYRLGRDLQCLTLREYGFAARQLVEVGRMVGGWTRSLDGTATTAAT